MILLCCPLTERKVEFVTVLILRVFVPDHSFHLIIVYVIRFIQHSFEPSKKFVEKV